MLTWLLCCVSVSKRSGRRAVAAGGLGSGSLPRVLAFPRRRCRRLLLQCAVGILAWFMDWRLAVYYGLAVAGGWV